MRASYGMAIPYFHGHDFGGDDEIRANAMLAMKISFTINEVAAIC